MQFPEPLIEARLVRRYKRFLADVVMPDGSETTVHCANPGAMTGLAPPGARVWLSDSRNPKRKLRLSWELVEADGTLVGINTAHPNRLAEEAIRAGLIPELGGFPTIRREVRYGNNSRVDLVLGKEPEHREIYAEVKNVHLRRNPGLAEFPDSVTARGTKHLADLAAMVRAGHRAVMLYIVQRADCDEFALAADIDPAYATAFMQARAAGVEAIAYACRVTTAEIAVARPLALRLPKLPAGGT